VPSQNLAHGLATPAQPSGENWSAGPRQRHRVGAVTASAYAHGGAVARSPAAHQRSWRRAVLPTSKRVAQGWHRARRRTELLTKAVGHRRGSGDGGGIVVSSSVSFGDGRPQPGRGRAAPYRKGEGESRSHRGRGGQSVEFTRGRDLWLQLSGGPTWTRGKRGV
jgi:hypothetical protein